MEHKWDILKNIRCSNNIGHHWLSLYKQNIFKNIFFWGLQKKGGQTGLKSLHFWVNYPFTDIPVPVLVFWEGSVVMHSQRSLNCLKEWDKSGIDTLEKSRLIATALHLFRHCIWISGSFADLVWEAWPVASLSCFLKLLRSWPMHYSRS